MHRMEERDVNVFISKYTRQLQMISIFELLIT